MLDMDLLIKKAGILIEALPYIQRLAGKTVVIKYGGNAMINEALKDSVMEDITLLKFIGLNPIVVHGGGPDISSALKTYGIESKFINGLRVTDEDTVKIAQMVLVGKTNKEIVAGINGKGGKAVGISGIDGALLECEKVLHRGGRRKSRHRLCGRRGKGQPRAARSAHERRIYPRCRTNRHG